MRILLVNPYVTDFACYDYWLKPLGLLYLSSILKEKKYYVDILDCMDRYHPYMKRHKTDIYGTGSFRSRRRQKPLPLRKYPKKYNNYGLCGSRLKKAIQNHKKPDYIIMTSGMTYWYPGVKETAAIIKEVYPETPLLLGGIYASLCPEHARANVQADYVIEGGGFSDLFKIIGGSAPEFESWPAPDYSFYEQAPYVVLRTSRGCPWQCAYCGIKKIFGGFEIKNSKKIYREVDLLKKKYNVKNIVFYDDALLRNPCFKEYLENPVMGVRYFTPNGLEVSAVDKAVASLLKNAGFVDPCISADRLIEYKTEGKMKQADPEEAADALRSAGYEEGEFSAYLIMGLPGQKLSEVSSSAEYLHSLGARINLAEYAVVPGSAESEKHDLSILEEPLLHNNSIFPSFGLREWGDIYKVKRHINKLNKRIEK